MDKEDEDESIFSEDMSEFEKASAFISSGKCSLSDAAVETVYTQSYIEIGFVWFI